MQYAIKKIINLHMYNKHKYTKSIYNQAPLVFLHYTANIASLHFL